MNPKTLQLTKATDLAAAAGSGPRHGTFLKTGQRTFFYLIAELANTVTVYDVTYNKNSLGFNKLFVTSTYGDTRVPDGAAAGEILLSVSPPSHCPVQDTNNSQPDSKFILLTSRLSPNITVHLPGQGNASSDPLITFLINPDSGELTYQSTSPAGGLTPRHFSLNKAGDRVAVGLQGSGRVAVFKRDVVTGIVGDEPVAWVEGLGEVSAIVFDE
jgi:6-phosphogluconolactonase (cycloisomerase 2 family)